MEKRAPCFLKLMVMVSVLSNLLLMGELLSVTWGLSQRQGKRWSMEDTYAVANLRSLLSTAEFAQACDNPVNSRTFKGLSEYYFFGVYDGHGGKEAAAMAAQELHKNYLTANKTNQNDMLVDAYEKTHKSISKSTPSGTTAVTAVVYHNTVNIAWVGDSRAVVGRGNRVLYETNDHKPENSAEKAAIEKRGGHVTIGRADNVARVDRQLAVARALGDTELAHHISHMPQLHEVKDLQIGDVIILACDGVWDVLSSQDAVTIVNDVLYNGVYPSDLKKPLKPSGRFENTFLSSLFEKWIEDFNSDRALLAARALRDSAYKMGSTDNISALVIVYSPQRRFGSFKSIPTDMWFRIKNIRRL